MRYLIAAVAAVAVACVPPEPEEWRVPDYWTIRGDIPGGQAEFDVALDTIREIGPDGAVPAEWLHGGVVTFDVVVYGNPAIAGKWTGGGYAPRSPTFAIATYRRTGPDDFPGTPIVRIEETALVHEIGHYLFARYGLRHEDHPAAFTDWHRAVNAEIARRLGR